LRQRFIIEDEEFMGEEINAMLEGLKNQYLKKRGNICV